MDDQALYIAELTAEIAALRCAMHALTHTLITPEASEQDAVRFFDSLARQWQKLDDSEGHPLPKFDEQAEAIRRQIVMAVERAGRVLH